MSLVYCVVAKAGSSWYPLDINIYSLLKNLTIEPTRKMGGSINGRLQCVSLLGWIDVPLHGFCYRELSI
jgi:hypothetical protein